MSAADIPYLTFDALDELALAAERGYLDDYGLPTYRARDVGPVLELSRFVARGLLPPTRSNPWLAMDHLDPLVEAFRNGNVRWVCPKTRSIGFLRTNIPYDTSEWTTFGLAMQRAAAGAGFPKTITAQFTAALGEFHSNVYEHSGSAKSGAIAFQAHRGRFEFAAIDGGIGVLQSLRENPAYANLYDSGEALRLALTDGVSRFGADSDRGYGFRPLFVGLANLNGSLRFRSGDHALLIDGQNPTLMTALTAQKPEITGLLISVACLLQTSD